MLLFGFGIGIVAGLVLKGGGMAVWVMGCHDGSYGKVGSRYERMSGHKSLKQAPLSRERVVVVVRCRVFEEAKRAHKMTKYFASLGLKVLRSTFSHQ